MMQDADDAVLLDRHADLKLHAFDHALAQGGDARFFDPVDSRQLFEDQGLRGTRPSGRWASPPVWASATAPNKDQAARAQAAIDLGIIMW